jgi:UDP-N-acetyl-D-mannosaminuronate dehydrogenase
VLARLLRDQGNDVSLHDPYVRPGDQNLSRWDLEREFTRDLAAAVRDAEIAFMCTGHVDYRHALPVLLANDSKLVGVVDGCNLFHRSQFSAGRPGYTGIGRGAGAPVREFVDFVEQSFRAVERGVANEVADLIDFFNREFAEDEFNTVAFEDVQRIAGTCVTGCTIVDPGPVDSHLTYQGFVPRLVRVAADRTSAVRA